MGGVKLFYREAGPRDAPIIVLLHGYPSSSRMYEPLIPLLAGSYHLIAPDYPGFGRSEAPPPLRYRYTFDQLAETMGALLERLRINRYVLFMQDYGGPVGLRMTLANPKNVQALIVQNANAYEEGLGPKWAGIAKYWADPAAHPDQVEAFMSLEGAKQRHIGNSPHPERYDPNTWTDEFALLSRPGQREIQAALLYDYRTNVAAYPVWQAWLRHHTPPTLVMWDVMIHLSSCLARWRTHAMYPRPRFISSMPVTSRWTNIPTRSRSSPAGSSPAASGHHIPPRIFAEQGSASRHTVRRFALFGTRCDGNAGCCSTVASMHGLFRILGVAVAFYVVVALRSGHVYARSGPWGRDFERDSDGWRYWSAIVSYSLLSIALIFIF
ncbi:MAG: alpha/beta fold hydrolase [Terriglobales bacterium]